jgi:cell division protein FtsA
VEKKGYLQHLGGGVVLAGGGALLDGAAELAKEMFGVPARIGYPLDVGGLVEEYRNPAYAAAVGLVEYGAEALGEGTYDKPVKKPKQRRFIDRMRDVFGEFF